MLSVLFVFKVLFGAWYSFQYVIQGIHLVSALATVISIWIIDRVGRRTILICSIGISVLALFGLIYALPHESDTPHAMSFVCIIISIVCFAIGLGPIPFLYTAEVFPQNARSTAMALTTLVNWLAGLLVTTIFPLLAPIIDLYVFAVVLVFSFIFLIYKVCFFFNFKH
jgi:MFS family permease